MDRNVASGCKVTEEYSRSLRGNVDRNADDSVKEFLKRVVPYVGTWIEMYTSETINNIWKRRSLRGNVDRN